jgi:hypothetical protein
VPQIIGVGACIPHQFTFNRTLRRLDPVALAAALHT